MTDLPGWVAPPELQAAWARIGESLERRGLVAQGRVVVQCATREERHALEDLLGRPVTGDRCGVDLADLERRVLDRAGAIGGLVTVAEHVLRRPLVNRPGQRGERRERRERPFLLAGQWLAAHPELSGAPWVSGWLDGVRRDGLLVRRGDHGQALLDALEVLARLAVGQRPETARTELAAQVLHDSHALDDGTLVAHLVLRGLAAAAGGAMPTSARERQALWESFGVVADSVSSTCLTLGLRWRGATSQVRSWNDYADRGDPLHLTRWDRRRADSTIAPGTAPLLVCENPRVLESVAECFAGRIAVVCTSGWPNLVTQDVLRQCARAGSALLYHGDFDWPGIAIANQVVALCAATPWLMSSEDYLTAPGVVPLRGPEVSPSWDDDLGAAMRSRGVAVHEEAVLDGLILALESLLPA